MKESVEDTTSGSGVGRGGVRARDGRRRRISEAGRWERDDSVIGCSGGVEEVVGSFSLATGSFSFSFSLSFFGVDGCALG